MKRYYSIATLRDCGRLSQADPFTALLASIPTIFNLFSKTPVTMDALNKIFPGNGYWTVALKQYLMQHIAWIDSEFQKHVDMKMKAFIQNVYSFTDCMDLRNAGCFRVKNYPDVYECDECTQKFFNVMQKEKSSGGTSPAGQYPGGLFPGTFNLEGALPWIIGGVAFILIMKNKKSKK